jgi:hypothetical protein
MARIANHQINVHLLNELPFVNYNGTIFASISGTRYTVWHWNTLVLDYNLETKKIEALATHYISQTTSTLVGRIVRCLPIQSVIDFLKTASVPVKDQRRIVRMADL